MNRGIATFTLDYGRCPKWLFERMVRLGREMTRVIISEYGPDEYLRRLSDPVWFQSLGTVLAFDWNASGLTTILTAALKEAIRGEEQDMGIFICGGKGKTSRKTPDEIKGWGNRVNFDEEKTSSLVYASRMSAKVDSSLIQDGYQIYHHSFMFTQNGSWSVIQQGMNIENVTARRYHWFCPAGPQTYADLTQKTADNFSFPRLSASGLRGSADKINFVKEPHAGIVSDLKAKPLNMTAEKSESNRALSTELVSEFSGLIKDLKLLQKHIGPYSKMARFQRGPFPDPGGTGQLTLLKLDDVEFKTHPVINENFADSKYLQKILYKLSEDKPQTYEELVKTMGVGPKTVRALALVAELIYNAKPSYEDPARYSFAHGGKDATPYPVDRQTYDKTIRTMKELVQKTRIAEAEKKRIFERLPQAG